MSKWPVSANRSYEIVSGEPQCCACDQPAVRFVSVQWGLGQFSDHPVCDEHLQRYRVDFDRFGAELRRLARTASADE